MDEGCWLPRHQRSGEKNLHPPAWLVQVLAVTKLIIVSNESRLDALVFTSLITELRLQLSSNALYSEFM